MGKGQAIGEGLFDITYLISVITMGIIILCTCHTLESQLFGAMAVILGCGDAFHLIPRVWGLTHEGLDHYPRALGIGKLVTSITMTVFYLVFYFVLELRYDYVNDAMRYSMIALSILRIGLCLLPQNQWTKGEGNYTMGIVRNIPFFAIGIIIMVLCFKLARSDPFMKLSWLAVFLSFLFYAPVVLLVHKFKFVGMLMIPKTIVYLWLVIMGYQTYVGIRLN
ncbi:hypothetical protein TVAG_476070 [Trichomonas vaginalis G3]|uniref:Uncharacterized protein n=1 Tax=Trichomonas vaginalis (strain ATCC PRA-98 / G3) TaxID=412133 RepID=A2DA30_TRIV3|nr:conserved domain protein family [Trichomonas vaginalis G3]EAY22678.1 hypothetical protein TVAG_476070 [Trichomonas vaginalis G3]KAI5525492.1 conserved domain protein family [Trichomonas vaginalis G3]|eukprot:XP_001583664.1 hypothetical protein [Trichomonas vaginalis G3]